MSLFPQFGVPLSPAALDVVSADLFELDFAQMDRGLATGEITAASGHTGVFSRGATLASVAAASR